MELNTVAVLEPGTFALPGSSTERFEGEGYGLGLSYFLVRTPQGKGVAMVCLHDSPRIIQEFKDETA